MRWRIAAMSFALAVVVAVGAWYVATHPSSSSTTPPPPQPTASVDRVLPLTAIATSAATPTARGVAARLTAAAADPAFGGALAALVVDGATGRVLFSRRPDVATTPASTAKVLTAAAALHVLGPSATFGTGVVRSGRTLVLVGGGDVTITERRSHDHPEGATLAELARRTAASLDTSRSYRLSYDAHAWDGPTSAAGWNDGYFTSGNVSRLSALELDEARQSDEPFVPRAADPARQAADAFARQLRAAGVRITGEPRPGTASAAAFGVAEVASPPVSAQVQRMLTDSDNDLAEALARQVASRTGGPATFAGAARAVTDTIASLGVPTAGVRLYDGSGLSRFDRVTPRALTSVLRLAAGDPDLQSLLEGMPVAAATGTVADRYRGRGAAAGAGLVRAKTGTLAGVNALAGTVVDADGRLLVFAFLTDHASDPASTEAALDRLAARLAGCGCAARRSVG